MLTSSEFSTLLKDRAEAATRVLERKRISLETAIEALEVVGYKVYQGNDGVYNVQPPRDRESKYDAFPTIEPSEKAKGEFLSNYPAMLSARDVAEITGLHVNSIRRLCQEGKIPSMKVEGRMLISKGFFMESLGIDKAAEEK